MSSIDKGHAGLREHCGEKKGLIMTYSRPCYTPQHRPRQSLVGVHMPTRSLLDYSLKFHESCLHGLDVSQGLAVSLLCLMWLCQWLTARHAESVCDGACPGLRPTIKFCMRRPLPIARIPTKDMSRPEQLLL